VLGTEREADADLLCTPGGRYISLETAIEETKEGYYDSLHTSSQGWHEARHSLVPWWEYFVGVMLVKAYRQFEERVGVTTARREARHDSGCGDPSSEPISLRRS
jgi:hypothetical protein